MSYILNLETATRNCSVAIARDGVTLALREVATEGYSHAEKLHVIIEEVLRELNLSFSELAAIAVSKGPGSYTGLRIGVSAAKGLCFATGIPLISVDTLKILAAGSGITDGFIVPMIDARRMEVYSQVFDHKLNTVRDVQAEIIDSDSLSKIGGSIYIVGDCQEKVASVLQAPNIEYLEEVMFPSADKMAGLSWQKFQGRQFEDVAYFEPFYLKDFIGTTAKN